MLNKIANPHSFHNVKLRLYKIDGFFHQDKSLTQQYHQKIEDVIIRALNDYHFSALLILRDKKRGYRDMLPVALTKVRKIATQTFTDSLSCLNIKILK